jgi:hypothetical protein
MRERLQRSWRLATAITSIMMLVNSIQYLTEYHYIKSNHHNPYYAYHTDIPNHCTLLPILVYFSDTFVEGDNDARIS